MIYLELCLLSLSYKMIIVCPKILRFQKGKKKKVFKNGLFVRRVVFCQGFHCQSHAHFAFAFALLRFPVFADPKFSSGLDVTINQWQLFFFPSKSAAVVWLSDLFLVYFETTACWKQPSSDWFIPGVFWDSCLASLKQLCYVDHVYQLRKEKVNVRSFKALLLAHLFIILNTCWVCIS